MGGCVRCGCHGVVNLEQVEDKSSEDCPTPQRALEDRVSVANLVARFSARPGIGGGRTSTLSVVAPLISCLFTWQTGHERRHSLCRPPLASADGDRQ